MAAVHLAARRLDAGAEIYMAAHDTAEWQRPFHRAGACRRCLRVGEPVYRHAFVDCRADCLGFRWQYHRFCRGHLGRQPDQFSVYLAHNIQYRPFDARHRRQGGRFAGVEPWAFYRCADQRSVACDFADGRRRPCRRHCDGGGDLLSEPLGCSFLSEKAA